MFKDQIAITDNGRPFSATIEGHLVTGRINVTGERRVFLCQDMFDGATANEHFGYRYSWRWDGNVKDFKFTDAKSVKMYEVIASERLLNLLPNNSGDSVKCNGSNYTIIFRMVAQRNGRDYKLELPKKPKCSYFDIQPSTGKITAWPVNKGEQQLTDNGRWKKAGRTEVKATKFIALFFDCVEFKETGITGQYINEGSLHTKLCNSLAELFSAKIKAMGEETKFLVSSKVSQIYNLQTSEQNVGILSSSCLRPEGGHGCGDHIVLFDYIKRLRVIYAKDSQGNLVARALLWHVMDNSNKTFVFMDRVYGNEIYAHRLYAKARQANWLYRTQVNSNINGEFHGNIRAKVTSDFINYAMDEGTIYFDSLCFLNVRTKTLAMYGGDYCLQDCDGRAMNNDDRFVCDNCGDRISEGDHCNTDEGIYCVDCYHERFFCCQSCSEMTNSDEAVYISDFGDICRCCSDNGGFGRCDQCDNSFDIDNLIKTIDDNFYCNNCIGEAGYHYCEDCEEYVTECDCEEELLTEKK